MSLSPELEDLIGDEVRALLGSHARVARVETVHATDASVVVKVVVVKVAVTSQYPDLVFKAVPAGAPAGTDLDRTAAVVALARRAGVPVAPVLAVDTSCRHVPWAYLVQEHVSGMEWRHVRPLLDQHEVAAAQREIAEAVLAMQSIRFDGYGELDHEARPAGTSLLAALGRRAGRIRREPDRLACLALLDRERDLLSGSPVGATLCHDDLHHRNVIFDRGPRGWRLTGLIDWDKAWAGPAESDVARMAFWDDMTGPGFWPVYRAVVPLADGEQERALLHQLMWCLEYDDGSARHAADTGSLARRTGLRRPPPSSDHGPGG